MLTHYVQLGAGYELSVEAERIVDEAHGLVRTLLNGLHGEVVLGSSTSALLQMLAECYGATLRRGCEIIVAQTGHEANIGPWKKLERHGSRIVWWEMDPEALTCPIDGLQRLLTDDTALVAFPHVSNLLGDIVDVRAVTEIVHAAGARVVVDGVAFAPHRAMDVDGWGVDWYAYSTYKVFGPHMAALWGRRDAVAELTGPNHFFIPDDDVPHKFELGGVSHEGCAGILGLAEYLEFLAGAGDGEPLTRQTVERAFARIVELELPLQTRLIDYLRSRSDIRIIGPEDAGASRVPTISFVHANRSSREITEAVHRSGIAIRHGHMYAYHLCEALGQDPDDGVVRVSMVHYNTIEEVDRLIEVLDSTLD
jgi:cysteine desulfurase family protein (TIGR01976 family)